MSSGGHTAEAGRSDWPALIAAVAGSIAAISTVVGAVSWLFGYQFVTALLGSFGYQAAPASLPIEYLIATGWTTAQLYIFLSATLAVSLCGMVCMGIIYGALTVKNGGLLPSASYCRAILDLDKDEAVSLGRKLYVVGNQMWWGFVSLKPAFKAILILASALAAIILSYLLTVQEAGRAFGIARAIESRLKVEGGCVGCWDYRTRDGDVITGILLLRTADESIVAAIDGIAIIPDGQLAHVARRSPDRARANEKRRASGKRGLIDPR